MSRHCYCTTTVEYYWMLDARNDCCEPVYWPQQAVYFTDLNSSMPMAGLSNHLGNDVVLVECCQPQRTLYEIEDQYEYQQAYHLQQQQQQQREQQDQESHNERLNYVPPHLYAEENGYGTTSEDDIVTDPQTENKPQSKKNIYRAKEGYLVEEPSSESDNEEPPKTNSQT